MRSPISSTNRASCRLPSAAVLRQNGEGEDHGEVDGFGIDRGEYARGAERLGLGAFRDELVAAGIPQPAQNVGPMRSSRW